MPPAQLVRLHRHSVVTVLVIGGDPARRCGIAQLFHRESALRGGPFVKIDCSTEEERLRLALQAWLSPACTERAISAVRAADRGTLFLDGVESLSRDAQRQLLEWTRRSSDSPFGGEGVQWLGRLVAGSDEPLAPRVARGSFLRELYDVIDKVRVELPDPGTRKDRPSLYYAEWSAAPMCP